MDDPFEQLRKKRETKEAEDEKARIVEVERRKQEELKSQMEQEADRRRSEQAHSFDELVNSVLERLREAAYPTCELYHPNPRSWGIAKKTLEARDSELWGTSWYDHYEFVINVWLEFNTANEPDHFECKTSDRTKESLRADLSYDSLVDTLNRLHDLYFPTHTTSHKLFRKATVMFGEKRANNACSGRVGTHRFLGLVQARSLIPFRESGSPHSPLTRAVGRRADC